MKKFSSEKITNHISFAQESSTPIRKEIAFIFKQYPELEHIGTQTEYAQYLETIFPESKVKDITTVQIKNIEKEKIRAYSLDFSLNAVYWTA